LKTYGVERRPIGLIPGQKEANKLNFQQLFEDSDIGRGRRAQVAKVVDTQCIEFSRMTSSWELNTKVDALCQMALKHPTLILSDRCIPTTRPGHRLPHAWVERKDQDVLTHDFVGTEVAFLLITDKQTKDWISAAEERQSKLGVSIKSAQIGVPTDVKDSNEQWEKLKGMKAGRALLVRPDNFVAWWSSNASCREERELVEAVNYLLKQSGKGGEMNGIDGVSPPNGH
jgi:2,4-dichlorophenol 6-monooxygenase